MQHLPPVGCLHSLDDVFEAQKFFILFGEIYFSFSWLYFSVLYKKPFPKSKSQRFTLFFSFETVLLCHPGRSVVVRSRLTATSTSWVQVILLPQSPERLGVQAPASMPG